MSRLIDADVLIEKAKSEAEGMTEQYRDFGVLVEWLVNKIPFAQPEIIRCKDCQYYDGRPCGIVNTADDYCSRAERRADEVQRL